MDRQERSWWRHTPNAISSARLAATPVLLVAALSGRRSLFTWLLFASLLSDILDGLIARAFNLRSVLGARLDSTADILVTCIGILGLFAFQGDVLRAHWLPLSSVIGLYFLEMALALWRYRRVSSFHTVLVRIAAYVQGVFIMSLLFWGYSAWVLSIMTVLAVLAYIEEIVLLALLPQWTSDVRGVYWVLAARRATAQT
jgi:phosphatidylglycerophosphate synthase